MKIEKLKIPLAHCAVSYSRCYSPVTHLLAKLNVKYQNKLLIKVP